jgi:hypothetical protein
MSSQDDKKKKSGGLFHKPGENGSEHDIIDDAIHMAQEELDEDHK